ncbi:MAG: tRNA modification GTPase, partial [Gammaproteobacteria bacterium]|nr:tRNA modification GTPase [Gammaproteobacteria bacterium]
LIELRMFVEAAIDFPEEEIDFLSEGSVAQKTEHLLQTISNIESLAKQGVLLKEGMKLVILGKPNAGKSSLLNALSGIDAAIVTELPGTTRDVIEQHIQIDGMPVHILDTAGLRETQDIIEQEGIKRALKAIETANQLLVVLDITDLNALSELQTEFASIFNLNIPMTFVHNKIDLTENSTPRTEEANQSIYLSAKTGEGLDLLKTHLLKQMGFQGTAEGQFSARRRHLEAMARAKSHIEQGLKRIRVEKAGELLAEELKQAQNALNEITGEFRSDDLLGKIFSSFCIGK